MVTGKRYGALMIGILWNEIIDMDLNNTWFQQDGVTCHAAGEIRDLLRTKFGGRAFSSNGDVSWGFVMRKTNQDNAQIVKQLEYCGK